MNRVFKVLLLVVTVVALNQAFISDAWTQWKVKHGKVYSNQKEEMHRRLIWERTLNYVFNHNNRADKDFSLHINQFADRDDARTPIVQHTQYIPENEVNDVFSEIEAPANFDWRNRGVIGPVHNQGMTGDVQAIVAAESIASLHAIATRRLYNLSYNEIIECGCGQGHLSLDIFGCIHTNMQQGLCTSSSYRAGTGRCNKNTCLPVAQVNGTEYIPVGNEDEMQEAVLKQPLMVYIDASRPSFEQYESGIYSDTSCSQTQLDHVLQLVGYGEINQKRYWICKNSFGVNWGMQGYILIERGRNVCGIATSAIYPY